MSRRQLKIGLWLCISFIIIAFLTIGYQDQIPIQFTDEEVRSNYYGVLIITIPCALVVATGLHYQLDRQSRLPVGHVIFGLLMGGFLLITAAFIHYFSTGWVDRQQVFRGRFTNKEIIRQYQSWPKDIRFIKVTPIISGFRYAIPIDTTNLPDHKWIRSTDMKNSN